MFNSAIWQHKNTACKAVMKFHLDPIEFPTSHVGSCVVHLWSLFDYCYVLSSFAVLSGVVEPFFDVLNLLLPYINIVRQLWISAMDINRHCMLVDFSTSAFRGPSVILNLT